METEIVKIGTTFGNIEIVREELREVPKRVLRKVNKDGTKVFETPIGKFLKLIRQYSRVVN